MWAPNQFGTLLIYKCRDLRTELRLICSKCFGIFVLGRGSLNSQIQSKPEVTKK